MKRKTRSILEEINAMSPKRDKKHIVESNGQQVIVTAINLINLINESFDVETASDLNKRLINKNNAINLIKIFLSTKFEGGRHLRRVKKI